MANSFNTSTYVALESLDLLTNKLKASKFFNADCSKEFKLKFPVGDTIRVEFPDRGVIRNGLTYTPSEIKRRYTTVSFDEPFGTDFELDSIESLLSSPRGRSKFSQDILEPRMAQLAQEIDSRCMLYAYRNAASVVGALGTNPSTYDAISGAARQKMVELGGWQEGYDKGIFVPPSVHRAVRTANIALHNPGAVISRQHKTGVIDQADGFDWYESMSFYRHTAGTWAGAVTVTSTVTSDGATSITLTCTNGDTFKKGDKFSIASVKPVNLMTRRTFGSDEKTFTITSSDQTISGTSATVEFWPPMYGPSHPWQNVDALPLASAALTLWPGTTSPNGKSGLVGVALDKLAFAIVGAELELPQKAEMAAQKTDPDSGISVAFIRDFDVRQRKMVNRFDCMIGFGSFYSDSNAIAIACA